ncbi:MAG: MFS transporter [Nitrososphaeraceae archaeon]|nr:MFS transporter [Nitrososphaeraceae archaeon]
MVRWNIELPRLMPLVVESLRQEEAGGKKSIQDISKQILVVEDRPGLSFGSNAQRTEYPVLVIVKNSPFTSLELDLIKQRVSTNDASIIAMPAGYVRPPYDSLLSSTERNNNVHPQQQQEQSLSQVSYDLQKTTLFGLKPPTDDSPFYFAKEQIPKQLVLLIETVLGVSAVLSLLLVYYSRVNKIRLTASSRFHLVFVILIGLGFIFLEITFIQKFLLLLGTPIMALTVILFSILLSSGVGAYLSGKLFKKNPYKAVVISIPLLAAILLAYYVFLQDIISFSIVFQLYQRIMLTFALLSPAGLLMGFQFPSITRMASSSNQDITLLWGVNVIASVIGTVLTTTSSMVIGFNGNLLVGLGLYSGALASGIAATRITQKVSGTQVIK